MRFWSFGGGGGAVRVLLHNTAWPNTSYPAQPWPGLELRAVPLPQPSLCCGHGAHPHMHLSIEVFTPGVRLLSQNVAESDQQLSKHTRMRERVWDTRRNKTPAIIRENRHNAGGQRPKRNSRLTSVFCCIWFIHGPKAIIKGKHLNERTKY